MVLIKKGQNKHFDPHLIQLIVNKKNLKVVNILQRYCPGDSSSDLHELTDDFQATLLHYAAEYGNSDIVKYLLDSNTKIDAQDHLGRTPLMLAIRGRHEYVVQDLLKVNADIDIVDCQGKNTLQMIFEHEIKSKSMLKIFFQYVPWQRIIKTISSDDLAVKLHKVGCTAETALEWGHAELMKIFLNKDRSAIHARFSGRTMLHTAIQKKMMKIAKVLIEYGANVNALDSSNAIPLFYLRMEDFIDKCIENLELLKLLTSNSTFLTSTIFYGSMQIYNILVCGSAAVMEILFQSEINLYATDEQGNTVLHSLVQNVNADLFKLMQGRNFDVNAQNMYGSTPLIIAVECNAFNAMEFLLENDADVSKVNNLGNTALHLVLKRSGVFYDDSVELLLRHGADPQTCVTNTYYRKVYTIFDLILMRSSFKNDPTLDEHLSTAEPVIARLAMIEALGCGQDITELIRKKINMQASWKAYFDMCLRSLEQMKKTTIYGSVTLFRFLSGNRIKTAALVRNEEFVSALKQFVKKLDVNFPYFELVQRHFTDSIFLAECRKKVVVAICRLINLDHRESYIIAENIVDYLSIVDKGILHSV